MLKVMHTNKDYLSEAFSDYIDLRKGCLRQPFARFRIDGYGFTTHVSYKRFPLVGGLPNVYSVIGRWIVYTKSNKTVVTSKESFWIAYSVISKNYYLHGGSEWMNYQMKRRRT